MSPTDFLTIVISAALLGQIIRLIVRAIWGAINYIADQWLRQVRGFDPAEEFIPMQDYTPIWRLIHGTGDLKQTPRYIQRRMF